MNKFVGVLLSLTIYGFSAIGLLFWAFVVFRLFKYAENHVGWNILWSLGLFLPLAGISLTDYFLNQNRLSLVIGILAVISVAAVLAIYQFNVLVPYEIWLKRGMPNRPF